MKSKLLTLVVGLCMGNFCASSATGAQFFWNTPTGGAFSDPNNWLSGMVPGTMDNPVFFQVATYAVSFPTIAETGPLNVVDGNVTFSLGGNTYTVTGNVDVGGNLAIPLGVGAITTPTVSLAVNNGTLDAVGNFNVFSGAALKGSGTVLSTVPGGGVINSGTVAPGNSPGILTIDGDYEQTAQGTLEIEVGGLIPGSEHDQLQVTGSALLAGRLDVPFINGYMPLVGQNITYLQAASVSGTFDIISLPDYQASPVAVQVNILPTGASLSFVTPTVASAAAPDPNSPTGLWGNPSTWTGDVPITSDVVDMVNLDPSPTRVDLDVGTPASKRAFAHEVNISSLNPPAPFTLGIPSGTSLSAINHVAVGANGIVEMSGGDVFTNLVQVDVGGKVVGNGTIAGDVVLGNGLGSGEATLNPGSSVSAAGVINVENLTINSDGVLAIAIEDPNNFGQVVVEQTTTRGGRLVIDASNYVAPIGTQFNIIVSGTIEGRFDSVETVGSSSVFFAQVLPAPLAALGGETYFLKTYPIGDMNLDGIVNGDDAADFVLGLLDPIKYSDTHLDLFPVEAGNFSPGNTFDFDDIQGFSDLAGLVAADIFALIEQMSVPEPTTGGLLLLATGLLGATRSWRFKYSVGRLG